MDFNGEGLLNNNHDHDHQLEYDEEDQLEHNHLMGEDLRRGPWTVEEDVTLMNYISIHGEGRWNSLATCAGLKRTGKSCRLRWLNYLRPDVRRGNITLEEQLLILELHSRWGNRWSKIAQQLPGRTDNEIKNYWRTRVQKHAKQLKCDVNSKQFKDTMRYLWMPRLLERINAAAASTTTTIADHHQQQQQQYVSSSNAAREHEVMMTRCSSNPPPPTISSSSYTHADHHSMGSSSDSTNFQAQVLSPASSSDNNNNNFQVNNNNNYDDEYYNNSSCYNQQEVGNYTDMLISPSGFYNNNNINQLLHGFDHFQSMASDHNNNNNNNNNLWCDDFGDVLLSENSNLWNVVDHHQVDISFLQQQQQFITNNNNIDMQMQ